MLRSSSEVLLNQRKYILELISGIGLAGAKPTLTPLETYIKLNSIKVDEVVGVKLILVMQYRH